ncbi:hypothetical protein BT96DRAFT_154403 [Gymnopus androsaceus JB14]|uniref:Uncharacterized protein n=1 Tax=Gymnopus androsaceus JB14 TaxID=1447944 RepID=A0A6A4HCC2_9AGAR|nr:hypothetical protein BT96DRAFT_154403 [Gymnopus androsaceus JB14]
MSSTFTSTSNSTASSSPISNSGSNSGDSKRLVITGVILGILGAIGVGLILWWTMRMKPKVPYEEEASEPASRPQSKSQSHSRTTSISTRRTNITRKSKSLHLANAPKITPFNPLTSQDVAGPRFVHTPGTNMRIATRLSNGIWQFSEPQRGLLGQSNPFEPSLQVLLDQRTRSPSPGPTYLSPISTYSPTNPFSDPNVCVAYRPTQSIQFSMLMPWIWIRNLRLRRRRFKPYPFTRPGALTASRTQTQAQSVYRGTIYDLQKLHSIYSPSSSTGAGTLVPAGIHDLDDEIRAHKGKPLPVAESELMRREFK